MLPEDTTKTLPTLSEDRIPQTEEVVSLIVKTMKRHAHRAVSRATAKLIYEAIIEHTMTQTIKRGCFRLPSGWGSFCLKMLGEGTKPRRLPNGRMVERKTKGIIRYQQGSIVRQMFGTQTANEYRRTKPRRSAVVEAVGENVDLSAADLNAEDSAAV